MRGSRKLKERARLRGDGETRAAEKSTNKKSGRKGPFGDFCPRVEIPRVSPKIKFRGL